MLVGDAHNAENRELQPWKWHMYEIQETLLEGEMKPAIVYLFFKLVVFLIVQLI